MVGKEDQLPPATPHLLLANLGKERVAVAAADAGPVLVDEAAGGNHQLPVVFEEDSLVVAGVPLQKDVATPEAVGSWTGSDRRMLASQLSLGLNVLVPGRRQNGGISGTAVVTRTGAQVADTVLLGVIVPVDRLSCCRRAGGSGCSGSFLSRFVGAGSGCSGSAHLHGDSGCSAGPGFHFFFNLLSRWNGLLEYRGDDRVGRVPRLLCSGGCCHRKCGAVTLLVLAGFTRRGLLGGGRRRSCTIHN